jgi:tetratricopeptide (TPR) repeat protein
MLILKVRGKLFWLALRAALEERVLLIPFDRKWS